MEMTEKHQHNIFALIDSGKHGNMELAMELAKGTGDSEFVEQVEKRIKKVLERLQMEAFKRHVHELSQAISIDAISVAKNIMAVAKSFQPPASIADKIIRYPSMEMFEPATDSQAEALQEMIDRVNREAIAKAIFGGSGGSQY